MSSDYQAQLNDICLAKIVYLWLHLKVSIEFQKKFEKRLDVVILNLTMWIYIISEIL